MKRFALAILFVLVAVMPALARLLHFPSPPQVLQSAEKAFAEGVALKNEPDQARPFFLTAAGNYEFLYAHGYRNPDLCRNWGNAEFLADRLPQAILAWRLGLLYEPGDAELLANLEYARDQVEYPPGNVGRPEPNLWPGWLPTPSLNTVLLASLGAYALTWALATLWLVRRRWTWFLLTGVGIMMIAGLTSVGVFLILAEEENKQYPLVVAAKEHVLHRGNGASYPANEMIATVRPGMEAKLLHRRGDWIQIELPGGHVGWVPASAALVAK